MSRSRAPLLLGLTAAGGIGYYLYGAGGNPKVAEKQFEADVHKASAKVKGELPGRGQQYEKEAQATGRQVGAKFDEALAKTQAELQKGKAEAAAYAKDAKSATIQEIDKFDKKVEEKASQAKSGVSSWFGGK
ncbi:hypothetical protein J7T55_000793 [Diaporthe amygdali]|uniref:uncharacterized protein n=1 Tax=Phomopsis amygdali TaxID=1214568 RepID=UPI0022FE7415|nr:uncharacterized protein J7T55_000793 [Diaporthe amygdali]KAJ0119943.1 hypothetical protein J7T55_000793 [Diaporthe amygdali]